MNTTTRKAPADDIREAQLIVAHIDALENSEAFQWFKDLIGKSITRLEESILDDDDLSHDQREALRQQRKALVEVRDRTRLDREGQVAFLEKLGIRPGDIPPSK